MKKVILFTVLVGSLMASAFTLPAATIRYYNKDSKAHTFKVKIAGSTTKVTFDGSKTSSVTIQGGSDEAIIYSNCGEVKVKSGDSVVIKDGCITVN